MTAEGLMREALELALRGRGQVEPNPRVGALALGKGRIVGRGWHRFWGGPHAEIEALAAARECGERADTLVVTLEPCSSQQSEAGKKTPPCTEAIVEAGIKKVVFGMRDPDPRHGGRGVAALEAAGVIVEEGPDVARCEAINRPFRRGLGLDRPWTIAKWAMSLDGKTAGASGTARWISGEAARKQVHQLRSRVDAVVVGFHTVRMDDPELTVRHVEGRQPIRIVVDPCCELEADRKLFHTVAQAPCWVLVREDAEPTRAGRLADLGVSVLRLPKAAGAHRLDLASAWRELRRRGLRRVLVEGGGGLLAELLAQGCLDQVLAFVGPKMIGGTATSTPLAGAGCPTPEAAFALEDLYSESCGEDILLGGFVI